MVLASYVSMEFYSESDYFRYSPLRYGALGVDLFFGLSGLPICKLMLEEWLRYGSVSVAGFYIRRCFRILPPLFVFAGVIGLLGLMRSRTEFISCFLFFRNYLPVHLGGVYTAHLWSLAIEEHFYLIWPGLLLLCGIKRAPIMTAVLIVVCALWRVTELRLHLLSRFLPDTNPGARTDLRFDALLVGCLMAFVLHDAQARDWLGRRLNLLVWLLAAAAFVLCIARNPPLTPLWKALLLPLLLAGTVLHPEWRWSRALELAPVRWIGRISYSLYIWQQLFLASSWESIRLPGPIQHFPYNLILAFALASASYYAIEKPLIRIGRRLATVNADRNRPDAARLTAIPA